MRKIACQNFKGGTGKTTSVVTLAHCLATAGKRVLIVDLDAQGNVGVSLGVEAPGGLYELLVDNRSLTECMVEARPNLFCILADASVAACETILVARPRREESLSRALRRLPEVVPDIDVVLLDCSPSLSILSQNALVYADELVIPVSMDYLAMVGANHVYDNLAMIEEFFDKRIRVAGILPTFFDQRVNMSKEVLAALRERYGDAVLTPIRTDTRMKQASSARQTIFEFSRRSRAGEDYQQVCRELFA
ncbi:MAG: ParA family protein [Deltaproteobacteria bacterium]|nr:ParA family protein [Candidatus Anaeroferrophillacea bacterium]